MATNNSDPKTPARGTAEDSSSIISAATLSTIKRDRLEDDDDGSLQLSDSPEPSSVNPVENAAAQPTNIGGEVGGGRLRGRQRSTEVMGGRGSHCKF